MLLLCILRGREDPAPGFYQGHCCGPVAVLRNLFPNIYGPLPGAGAGGLDLGGGLRMMAPSPSPWSP